MTSKFDINQNKSGGGIYTARGNHIPPSPNVPDDVKAWGMLVSKLREAGFTAAEVEKICKEHKRAEAEKLAKGESVE